MASIVRMPEVLAGASEAILSHWLVAEGTEIAVGDVLAEIETEKATVEYQAEEAGTLGRTLIGPGDTAEVGTPIAIFLAPGEGPEAMEQALADVGAGGAEALAPAQAPEEAGDAESVVQPGVDNQPSASTVEHAGGRVFQSPLVRRRAREENIDVAQISGTGPGGRITRRDLEAFLQNASAQQATVQPSEPQALATPAQSAPPQRVVAGTPAEFRDVPHTGMRKAIARRLTESKSTVPHFYLSADVRVDKLLATRSEMNAASGVRISVNDWVLKGVAHALVQVPEANVIWTDTALRMFSRVDIAVAVATEGGLLTPVLRGVESMSLREINAAVVDAAERARSGSIRQDEIEGGSFAVTNLGMYGVRDFQAIINPPQSGILAVGAAQERPFVENGQLGVATLMTVSLSADHRAVDGALAATWLAAFVNALENPLGMLA